MKHFKEKVIAQWHNSTMFFLISDDLESIGVSLNIPAFLNGRDQLIKARVKESQAIP